MNSPRALAVTIARFQTHALTEAHKYLLSQVATRAARALVLIGVPPVTGRFKDPLEFSLRARMVQDYWAEHHQDTQLWTAPAFDCVSDVEWAMRVDQTIAAFGLGGAVTLYGGHDSCCEAYKAAAGKHAIEIIDNYGTHASKVRAALLPRDTEDFRAGIIYQNERRIVNPFPIVDVAVFRPASPPSALVKETILLGQKDTDGGALRLIGGFIDQADESAERAGQREVREETGIEVGPLTYAGSGRVDDWRWRGGPEGILSLVYIADYAFGNERAADDLGHCAWYPLSLAKDRIHDNHKHLLELALKAREATRVVQSVPADR